jgi:glucokinase
MTRYAIGVDLGGTQLRAVRVDHDGHVAAFARADTAATEGPAAVVAQIAELIATVQGETTADDIIGVGVGTPGPVDPLAGIVWEAPNLRGWANVPLKQMVAERTGLPVEIGNDANVAALGEWRFGSGRGCTDFVYVTISTGIGGGVISNNALLLGRRGGAGEVGHMTIQTDGPLCGCGNVGCWEAVASGTALARFAATALERRRPSLITDFAGEEPLTARHIAAAAEAGDELALELMERQGDLIGVGVVNVLHLYAPERVALGGGVTKSMPLWDAHMRRTVAKRAMLPYRDTSIGVVELGDQVGVLGAAALLL